MEIVSSKFSLSFGVNGIYKDSVSKRTINRYLAQFPDVLKDAFHGYIAHKGRKQWLFLPNQEINNFKNTPVSALQKIDRIFLNLQSEQHSPFVSGAFISKDQRGIEYDELQIILNRWMNIERSNSIRVDNYTYSIVTGSLKCENFAFTFRLNNFELLNNDLFLDKIINGSFSIAFIFLSIQQIKSIFSSANIGIKNKLQQLCGFHQCKIGISIAKNENPSDIPDARGMLIKILGNEHYFPISFFENIDVISEPKIFWNLRKEFNIEYDCSLLGLKKENNSLSIETPYLGPSPYFPMNFDIRIPAASDNGMLIEIPHIDFDEWMADLDLLNVSPVIWRDRWQSHSSEVANLMSFQRMESYYANAENSIKYKQLFYKYKLYNRPQKNHDQRITLIDIGKIDSVEKFKRKLEKFLQFKRNHSGAFRVVTAENAKIIIDSEARFNCEHYIEEELKAQVNAHGYLSAISINNPLRTDIDEFQKFIPNDLGSALEIGSGYGQLAIHLAKRSSSYVCLDLIIDVSSAIKEYDTICMVGGDAHHMPFTNNIFSTVIANNILEHLYDPLSCLIEIRRVLKNNGSLFALIPLDGLDSSYDIPTHLWKADVANIQQVIKLADLQLVELKVLNLYALGVEGSFPTCKGLVAMINVKK